MNIFVNYKKYMYDLLKKIQSEEHAGFYIIDNLSYNRMIFHGYEKKMLRITYLLFQDEYFVAEKEPPKTVSLQLFYRALKRICDIYQISTYTYISKYKVKFMKIRKKEGDYFLCDEIETL